MDSIQALKRTMLFGGLDRPDLEALAARATERRLRRGEILFMAGDPAGGLYVVVEGAIRAFRVSADGREQTIHVEKGGATLAEVSVFDEGPYPSTTAAEEDSVLLFIDKHDVLNLCLERPRISLAALKLLAGRMRNCAALVESLSLRDVDRRLAKLLLEEASDHSRRSGSSVTFELALNASTNCRAHRVRSGGGFSCSRSPPAEWPHSNGRQAYHDPGRKSAPRLRRRVTLFRSR
jgi:CRP-like cAMP-binding protein